MGPRLRPRARAVSLVLGSALALAACAPRAPTSIAPLAPSPPTCPLEGCDGERAAKIASAHAPDACLGAGQSACGGASAHECAERALAAWGEAQNDREVACVARTLAEACTLGDPPACGYAGRMLLDGFGIARDAERGLAMLTKACEADIPIACLAAIRWLNEERNASTIHEGSSLRSRLDAEYTCLTGAADECYSAGLSFFAGRPPFPCDYIRSAAEYRHACDQGHAAACSNLGDAHEYGNGVPRDLAQAARLYQRACHAGYALGCSNLGHLAENGEGIARDAARARELYKDACAAGEVYGCLHLQMMASPQAGSPRDPQRALEQWQRACDHRDGRACAFVGVVYEDGPDGLARDEKKSLDAMKQSCKLGYQYGCDWAAAREGPEGCPSSPQ
jgi:TPR repeat protein